MLAQRQQFPNGDIIADAATLPRFSLEIIMGSPANLKESVNGHPAMKASTTATNPAGNQLNDRPGNCASNTEIGLTVHAVLPPPVTGMTLCTERVATAVAQRAPVRRYNWSNGSTKITFWFRFIKALRALTTPARLLFGSRPGNGVFYMPCNAGIATVFNLWALAAARLRGYRCVLHHHYYRYVDRFEWRIKLLARILGPNDLQIVLCPRMERQFRALYGSELTLAVIPSTIQLLQAEGPPPNAEVFYGSGPFYVGHISNLQLAKGLDLVLDVFRELRHQKRDAHLILAGPTDTDAERCLIEAAQIEFGERFDYRGPVYGAEKQKFFRDIHAKIYPTRLDAQPLVIMEAFANGRPVISYARGCIPEMIPCPEWLIDPGDHFVQHAVEQLIRWIDDRTAYGQACRLARQAYETSCQEARTALDNFVRWVCNEATSGFVCRGIIQSTDAPARIHKLGKSRGGSEPGAIRRR